MVDDAQPKGFLTHFAERFAQGGAGLRVLRSAVLEVNAGSWTSNKEVLSTLENDAPTAAAEAEFEVSEGQGRQERQSETGREEHEVEREKIY